MDLIVNLSNPEEKKKFIQMIEEMNGRHCIYMQPYSQHRSLEMNRYYRVLLRYAGDLTGNTDAYMHLYFKNFYSNMVKWIDWGVDPDISTANMTKSEMMQYFGWIKEYWGATFYPRVIWPDPNDVIRPNSLT